MWSLVLEFCSLLIRSNCHEKKPRTLSPIQFSSYLFKVRINYQRDFVNLKRVFEIIKQFFSMIYLSC